MDGDRAVLLLALAITSFSACHENPSTSGAETGLDASIVDKDGSWPSPDATPDAIVDAAPDVTQMLDTGMVMIEEVATIIHETENDCATMTRRLREYQAVHGELMERTMPLYRGAPHEERLVIEQKYRPRFRVAWKKLRPGVLHCKSDLQAAEVLDELWRAVRPENDPQRYPSNTSTADGSLPTIPR